jgi:aerobic-type carbon monoxide dehydrogenase small subunit (CoxS/CutS family)
VAIRKEVATMIKLKVNRKDHAVDVSPDTPLPWMLRENLGLTGTKFGYGMALCGARTVQHAKWGEVARIANMRLDQ